MWDEIGRASLLVCIPPGTPARAWREFALTTSGFSVTTAMPTTCGRSYTGIDARRFAARLHRSRALAPGGASMSRLGIRWTIGDVSDQGFEALQCSIWGAWNAFGPDTAYAVCVNTVSLDRARSLTGVVPEAVRWHWVARDLPAFLIDHVDAAMAEGVAWKLAPVRMYPDRYELSLDNDCILWDVPEAIRAWLAHGEGCVLAEDVRRCFGKFSALCGPRPMNLGIRGIPPGLDLGDALA